MGRQNEDGFQGSYPGSKVAQNESSKKRNITPALDSKDDSRTKDRSSLDSAPSKKRKLEDNKKDRRTSSGRDARKVKQTTTRKGGKQVKKKDLRRKHEPYIGSESSSGSESCEGEEEEDEDEVGDEERELLRMEERLKEERR